MKGKSSLPPGKSRSFLGWILFFVIVALIVSLFFTRTDEHNDHAGHLHGEEEGHMSERSKDGTLRRAAQALRRAGDPDGAYDYLYDKANGANRFLLSKAVSKNFLPESDAPAGADLWIRDESGKDRLIAEDVYRAKFSPDGNKIAYTTVDCVMHVEDLSGNKIAEVERAYEPNWRSDSAAIVYAAVPEGRHVHIPEVLGLSIYDLNSSQTKKLTDGQWDDVRPHFDPSDEWVLFVSGARSGLASFWRVPVNGGPPEQITNTGMQQINDLFVPTPYDRTIWSDDKRWFVYDFKNGDRQEIWGLEFDEKGKFKGPTKIGEGLDPRWGKDSRTIVSLRQNGGRTEPVEYKLP